METHNELINLNVGCGPFYKAGWTNTDLIHVDGSITPDVVVTSDNPFPFKDNSVGRAYCGHVLEHVPWHVVPSWLENLKRVLAPGAEVMFVGPDAYRVLQRWKEGKEEWSKALRIIEGVGAYQEYWEATVPQFADGYAWAGWDGDRHHWNCTEARVMAALKECGFIDVEALPLASDEGLDADLIRSEQWPLVDGAPCQFAVRARKPLI